MFVKTLYGEVQSNSYYGQDSTFQEVGSIAEARKVIRNTIELDHDYPTEWLISDVESARSKVDSLDLDEGRIKIRDISAGYSGTYSVYEYSIVSEAE